MYLHLQAKLKRIEWDLYKPNPLAMQTIRSHRDNLINNSHHAKQSVKEQQIIKRIRFYDYVLGRMIFFKEDHRTAWHKAEIKRILGEL